MSTTTRWGAGVLVTGALILCMNGVGLAQDSPEDDIVAGNSAQAAIDPGLTPAELQSTYAAEDELIDLAADLVEDPSFDATDPDPALAAEVTAEQDAAPKAGRRYFTCVLSVFHPWKEGGYANGKTRNDCSGAGISAQSISGCLAHINNQGHVHVDDCRSNAAVRGGSIQIQPSQSCRGSNESRYWINSGSGIVRGATSPPAQSDSAAAVLNCNP